MTDEEITNLLREAGVVESVLPFSPGSMQIMRRFAQLVLNAEKKPLDEQI